MFHNLSLFPEKFSRSSCFYETPIGLSLNFWEHGLTAALFIIGVLGALNICSGLQLGWAAAIFGFAKFAVQHALGKMKKDLLSSDTLMMVSFVALGIFAGIGLISARAMGYGILLTPLFKLISCCFKGSQEEKENYRNTVEFAS